MVLNYHWCEQYLNDSILNVCKFNEHTWVCPKISLTLTMCDWGKEGSMPKSGYIPL